MRCRKGSTMSTKQWLKLAKRRRHIPGDSSRKCSKSVMCIGSEASQSQSPPEEDDTMGVSPPSIMHSSQHLSSIDSVAPSLLEPSSLAEEKEEKPRRQVRVLPSVFDGRPPVIFFTYTEACSAEQRPLERSVLLDIDAPKVYYSHTDAVHEYNAVINTLRQGGLYRTKVETGKYSVLWSSHPAPETLNSITPLQRTNHFPGSHHLGRKDLLWKNLSRMQRKFGKTFAVSPQGFNLPKDLAAFERARVRQPGALWIWKPCSSSCGRGIKILSSSTKLDENPVTARKRGVIQGYVDKPLLIDGYKFDLRLYVVVLSYDPLKVYVCKDGLVRLATQKYSVDPNTLGTQTMHLTNYSINKQSSSFIQNTDKLGEPGSSEDISGDDGRVDPSCASKWSLKHLRAYFERQNLDYDQTFERVSDLLIKTLIAVEPQMRATWCSALGQAGGTWQSARGTKGANAASCFEMYGFDVILDSNLEPWLLEVNICPSLSSGSPLDKRIKTKLVADSLTLVGIPAPPHLLQQLPLASAGVKRRLVDVESSQSGSHRGDVAAPSELAARHARLSAAEGLDAVALFDEAAWEIALTSYEEDMRSGGLERIFPCADGSKYVPFFEESLLHTGGGDPILVKETYANLVLRKWHEAGGGSLFTPAQEGGRHPVLPPWVPRQVAFTHT